ncbi:hypothetical protein Hanom_Chr10g00913361 [Helianthus anomalus]
MAVIPAKFEEVQLSKQKLEKLKLLCLQYAAVTQWLMNFLEVPEDSNNPSYESCKVLLLELITYISHVVLLGSNLEK